MSVNFQNVFYVYNKKTPFESEALNGVSFSIKPGSFTALVGRTGCGKSTLVQHINALLNPSDGEVEIEGWINSSDKKKRSKNVKELRKKVGLVFQFPEYQLFEENVEKDVSFGPKNFGLSKEEAIKRAHEALSEVGLGEDFYKRSPFELSGGEKRKVAIAGILAIKPSILVVDEPTAGLDPLGALDMMELFKKVHEQGATVILVSHDMNIVYKYAEEVIVMDSGKIAKISDPVSLFNEDIEQYSLETPTLFKCVKDLQKKGLSLDISSIKDVSDLASQIVSNQNKGAQK